jgi:hypothetical protein
MICDLFYEVLQSSEGPVPKDGEEGQVAEWLTIAGLA